MKEFLLSFYHNKTRLIILIVVLLILGYFGYKQFSSPKVNVRYLQTAASKQTIITSVTGSGQVSQDRTVSLLSPTSATLTAVNVKQGDAVKTGQVIAVVNESNNLISLNQAKASLASAEANYNQVLAGSTSQDIQLAQLALQADQQALDSAKSNYDNVVKQQQLAVDNARSNYLNSDLSASPSGISSSAVTITLSGAYTGTKEGQYNISLYATGGGLGYNVTGLGTSSGSITRGVAQPLGAEGLYITFGTTGTLNAGDTWTINIPNTQSVNYLSNLHNYQAALNTQTASLQSAQNQIASAQNKLDQDKINLGVKQQPPTAQAIESAKAQLIQAQSQMQNAQIAYDNNLLKSPFDGVVAQLNSRAGDQVSPSTIVATLVTQQSLASISLNEVDVSKIKPEDKATMTFDAVDGLTITGKVAQIDNIGTVTQGVVNYGVKISFDTEDARIKPGMSVNVSIITNVAPDVLAVPNSAVKTQNGRSYVEILDPGKITTDPNQTGVTSSASPRQVTVQTGIANDSYTQIVSGLNENDMVVTQTINPTATKTTTQTTGAAGIRIPGIGGGGGGFGGRGN